VRGDVKVLDFGLAKLLPSDLDFRLSGNLTETYGFVGTLPYMAPEQLQGKRVDARTDIYALGAVLWETAAGERPFSEEFAPKLIDDILHKPPVLPRNVKSQIPTQLEKIILKCLEKDPQSRYQHAQEALKDLLQSARTVVPRWRFVFSAASLTALLLGILIAWRTGVLTPVSRPVPEAIVQQITANPIDDPVIVSVISPDGRHLAYTDLTGLHLRLMQTGESHSLPLPEGMCFR
jgi:serine/threonine protein kinase